MKTSFFRKYSSRRGSRKEETIIQLERVRMKLCYFGMPPNVILSSFLVMPIPPIIKLLCDNSARSPFVVVSNEFLGRTY